MDDPLKKVSDQSINGRHGAPRFDPGQLRYAEINDRYVTFYLRTHAVAVMINDLTSEEAGLARLYYQASAPQLGNEKAASNSDAPKNLDVDPVDLPEPEYMDARDGLTYGQPDNSPSMDSSDATIGEKRKSDVPPYDQKMADVISGHQPFFVLNIRLIFLIGIIVLPWVIFFAVAGPDIVGDFLKGLDEDKAIPVAMQDVSLRQFVDGTDLALDATAYYYDPALNVITDTYSKFMLVQITAFGMKDWSVPHNEIVMERFDIVVDLENKSIVSSKNTL